MSKWWEQYSWRLIQTNLREIDMSDIDAEQYVRELKSFPATVAMINTSGIIASYKTELPFHYQSPFLTGDSLEDIISVCHREGIRVIARTDFSKVRRPIYEAHPEWAYVDGKGGIVDYNGDVHVCINGEYQQKYALHIIKETLEKLDADGIFFNMGGYTTGDYSGVYHGICHCEGCKKRFFGMYGLPLPGREDMEDPVFRKYARFRSETTDAYNQRVCEFIKNIRPDILINGDTYTRNSGFFRQESNTALDRVLPHSQYSASENTKWVRGSYPSYISSNTTVDFIDFPARHAAVSPYQQELRLIQGLANGGSPDYYLIGRLDNHADKSGHEGIRRIFEYHAHNEELYKNMHSECKTALISGVHREGYGEYSGVYRVLSETHQLFDVVLPSRVAAIGLEKYDTVILPDIRCMDNGTAEVLNRFVARGGKLLATGRTSFLDENHEKRTVPALACLGIENTGTVRFVRGAYLLDPEGETGHTPYYLDGEFLYVHYCEEAEGHLPLLPPQPFGPPERCYPLVGPVDRCGATLNRYGEGLAIHIPWMPGQLFHRQGHVNTLWFLQYVFEKLLDMRPVGGNIPPTVEATLLKNSEGTYRIFHLVNNNGHFGNTFYEPTPVSDIQCRIPLQHAPSSVVSLVEGGTSDYCWEQGTLRMQIKRLRNFEALLIR